MREVDLLPFKDTAPDDIRQLAADLVELGIKVRVHGRTTAPRAACNARRGQYAAEAMLKGRRMRLEVGKDQSAARM